MMLNAGSVFAGWVDLSDAGTNNNWFSTSFVGTTNLYFAGLPTNDITARFFLICYSQSITQTNSQGGQYVSLKGVSTNNSIIITYCNRFTERIYSQGDLHITNRVATLVSSGTNCYLVRALAYYTNDFQIITNGGASEMWTTNDIAAVVDSARDAADYQFFALGAICALGVLFVMIHYHKV